MASNSPWLLSAIYPNGFNDIEYNDGDPEKDPISAYDALQSILDCWGCRIFQRGGKWWVVHHDMWRNDSSLHYYRVMSKVSSTPNVTGTLGEQNTFFEIDNVGEIDNNDIHGIKLAGGTETYYPPLRKTRATYSNWTEAGILGAFQEPIDFVDIATLESNLIEIGYVEAVGDAFINISHNVRIKKVRETPTLVTTLSGVVRLYSHSIYVKSCLIILTMILANGQQRQHIEIPVVTSMYQFSYVEGNSI